MSDEKKVILYNLKTDVMVSDDSRAFFVIGN